MNYSGFRDHCREIADRLSEKKFRHRSVYFHVIGALINYLEENDISLKKNVLHLESADVKNIYQKILKNRNYHNLIKCICLNDLLEALKLRKEYKGTYLNVPQQIQRELIFSPEDMPFELMDAFMAIEEVLLNPKKINHDDSPERKADRYFCEFLAIATMFGGISGEFYRVVLNLQYQHITFSPLTILGKVSRSDDEGENEAGMAYFRYWMPPIVEVYFLRLILSLWKNRHKLKYDYGDGYVFPKSWRTKEKEASASGMFSYWTKYVIKTQNIPGPGISLGKFRKLAVFQLSQKVPSFTIANLSRKVKCYSYRDDDIAFMDSALSNMMKIEKPVRQKKVRNDGKTKRRERAAEVKTFVRERRKDFLINAQFRRVQADINRIIRNIPRSADHNERKKAAENITKVISNLPSSVRTTKDTFLINLRFYGQWLIYMLYNKENRIKSIWTYASQIRSTFLFVLGSKVIHEVETDELIDCISDTFLLYDSRNIRSAIESFTNVLYEYQDSKLPPMRWDRLPWGSNKNLNKDDIRRTKPLIPFSDFRKALAVIDKEYSGIKRARMRVAIILGFFAGLRISEILHLTPSSLIYGGGHILRIRGIKSRSSARNIPLTLLLPETYMKEVAGFFESASSMGEDTFVFANNDPFEDSIDYSHEVKKIFAKAGTDMRFHQLRHAFANWFLLRWLTASYGMQYLPKDAPFLKEEVFSDKYLQYFRYILNGYGEPLIGQAAFSHVIAVLARMMGHAGPVTSMTSYIHIADWLYYRFIYAQEWSRTLQVKSSAIEEFMQLTYSSLPGSLKKRKQKVLPVGLLAAEQLNLLKSKVGIFSRERL